MATTIPVYHDSLPAGLLGGAAGGVDVSGVPSIIDAVRDRGDEAVSEFNLRFDRDALQPFELEGEALAAHVAGVAPAVKAALELAHERVRTFAQVQRDTARDAEWDDNASGVRAGVRWTPVDRVACYVPGGRFPLPSSALMTVTAARVAGVREVIVLAPRMAPETALAAQIAGADRLFRIGGPQAVAAAAFGTASVPRVDMIVGPGNAYVAEAKRLLIGRIGIDMIAGPSEVCIVADASADPARVAADLLAQAEHDPAAVPVLLTSDAALPAKVQAAIDAQCSRMSLPSFIGESLGRGAMVVLPSLDGCVAAANELAPEHLELHLPDDLARDVATRVRHFGCLFIGEHSAEVFGDYLAGTNHVLPTAGSARHSSGLSPLTFLMPRTWLQMTADAAASLSGPCVTLAEAEGLHGHAEAARLRG
ncbi:MAG: histidinol dehydrogenase [Planctomycetota bacterium]